MESSEDRKEGGEKEGTMIRQEIPVKFLSLGVQEGGNGHRNGHFYRNEPTHTNTSPWE
jgi:hypothetical protein